MARTTIRRRILLVLTVLFGGLYSTFVVATPAASGRTAALQNQLDSHPENTALRERLGQAYLDKKDYPRVIETLAPYSNEISNGGLELLALAYGQSKDSLNEIRTLTQLTEKDPRHFRPYYFLGLAYKHADKTNEAIENLRKSIDLAPTHRPSYDALLDVFTTKKQNYEARMLLSEMMQQFGPKKEILTAQCKLLADDGFLKEAAATCKKAISIDPRIPENHVYLAQTYYDQNNIPAAERIFITAAREFKSSEFVQYAAGQYYFTEKNFPTAVRYLNIAVKINAKSLRSQLTLANALFESKQYDLALEHYAAACHLDKSKDSMTQLKTAAARLRKDDKPSVAEKFDLKSGSCQE